MEKSKYDKLQASFEQTLPQMPNDFTERVMAQIESKSIVSRRWRWVAMAASVALLFSVGIVLNNRQSEQPRLIAQADTTKTEIKTVKEQPVQKVKETEAVDSVKEMKEQLRMPRPPRHYLAKAEPQEPEPVDAEELAERAFAEERRRIEMEMMVQMSGSLQADFESMTKEIRQRGERMTHRVEMALSEE